MKVFKLNDYEWWMGPDWDAVRDHYKQLTGLDDEEAFDDPRELTDREMLLTHFRDDDGTVYTFAEWRDRLIERGEGIGLFAGVEA
jgi:hypothetical protein